MNNDLLSIIDLSQKLGPALYTDSGLTAPADAVLDQVVQAGRGSARSIFSDVVMSANQARRDGRGGVDQINNIRS